jgi:flagellar biosynthetic protein FliP
MDLSLGKKGEGLRLSGSVGIVVLLGLMSLLPMLVLMMTGFTRILIVLHFLKQALGTPQAPPAPLVTALALILTGFVMQPTLREVNRVALDPWLEGRIEQVEMLRRGSEPFREFMLTHTRNSDLERFGDMADIPEATSVAELPLVVVMAAFTTSELRTAFQIGFLLFLPFLLIDFAVASVLMSMGMFMVSPALISLPLKLLLFVLADGWGLVLTGLVDSF